MHFLGSLVAAKVLQTSVKNFNEIWSLMVGKVNHFGAFSPKYLKTAGTVALIHALGIKRFSPCWRELIRSAAPSNIIGSVIGPPSRIVLPQVRSCWAIGLLALSALALALEDASRRSPHNRRSAQTPLLKNIDIVITCSF